MSIGAGDSWDFWDRMRPMWERMRPMDTARFANQALRAIAQNRAIIIVPGWWKIYLWLNRLCPSLVERCTTCDT